MLTVLIPNGCSPGQDTIIQGGVHFLTHHVRPLPPIRRRWMRIRPHRDPLFIDPSVDSQKCLFQAQIVLKRRMRSWDESNDISENIPLDWLCVMQPREGQIGRQLGDKAEDVRARTLRTVRRQCPQLDMVTPPRRR